MIITDKVSSLDLLPTCIFALTLRSISHFPGNYFMQYHITDLNLKKMRDFAQQKWDLCVLPIIQAYMNARQSNKHSQIKPSILPKMTPNYAANKAISKQKNSTRIHKIGSSVQIHVSEAHDLPPTDQHPQENADNTSLMRESTSLPLVSQTVDISLPPLRKGNDAIPLLTTRSVPLIPSAEPLTLPAVAPMGAKAKGQRFESASEGGSPRAGRRHKSMVGLLSRKPNGKIELPPSEDDQEVLHLPGLNIQFSPSTAPDERSENQNRKAEDRANRKAQANEQVWVMYQAAVTRRKLAHDLMSGSHNDEELSHEVRLPPIQAAARRSDV